MPVFNNFNNRKNAKRVPSIQDMCRLPPGVSARHVLIRAGSQGCTRLASLQRKSVHEFNIMTLRRGVSWLTRYRSMCATRFAAHSFPASSRKAEKAAGDRSWISRGRHRSTGRTALRMNLNANAKPAAIDRFNSQPVRHVHDACERGGIPSVRAVASRPPAKEGRWTRARNR